MDEKDLLKKALYTIKKLQAQQHAVPAQQFPIAIIGLSCRFPEAPNKTAFWQLLSQGRNVISHLPEPRWNLLAGTPALAQRDPQHPYWGGYLSASDITGFDAYFFGISPREASLMDPQQRLLLGVYCEALEDAGLTQPQLSGSNTGVFASVYASQFAQWLKLTGDLDALYVPTGNATSMAANRLSYLLDLTGPSLVVDTACSSTLTALHLACVSLYNKQCEVAIVGAANLNLNPAINLTLAKAKMLSPTGQCQTFDTHANGYVPGEGAGAIILKPLDRALAAQDRIYAVILGSKINQDGKTNGLTAPNGLQQQRLITRLYQEIGLAPEQLSYVECHGTGTFLGDPIEIQALGQAISQKRTSERPCFIGSVKTNLGHLEPAAGIASIIKTALALHHGQIPAHLNCATPNPHLDLARYHFRIPQQLEPWPSHASSDRCAGISGFGFGGANAHVALRALNAAEQAQLAMSALAHTDKQIFTLSAPDPAALRAAIAVWQKFLADNPSLNLAQLCYNLQIRRSHYAYRLAIICDTLAELRELLATLADTLTNQTALVSQQIFTNLFTPSAHKSAPTATALLQSDVATLAYWYGQQADLPWHQYQANAHFPQQDLPLYCWQHKDYWPDFNQAVQPAPPTTNRHLLSGKALVLPLPEQLFEFCFDTGIIPAIKDTFNIIHAGYYVEMLAFAATALHQQAAFTLENLTFSEPLLIPDGQAITVLLMIKANKQDKFTFSFYSRSPAQSSWTQHASGQLQFSTTAIKKNFNLAQFKQCQPSPTAADSFYQRILAMGMPAGASVRWTTEYWHNDNAIVCALRSATAAEQMSDFTLGLPPGVIDGCIQPIFSLLPAQFNHPYVADHFNKLTCFATPYQHLTLWAQLNSTGQHGEQLQGDWYLLNEHNAIIIAGEGMTMTQLSQKIAISQVAELKSTQLDQNLIGQLLQNNSALLDYLKNHVATLLAMPSADVPVDKSIIALGMNSLLALALKQTLDKFAVNYSLATLLQGPTLQDLADSIWQYHHTPPATNPSGSPSTVSSFKNLLTERKAAWIAYRQPQQQAKTRLFCFPYGGGGASIYLNWQQALPEFIEVCPVQLPGREDRADELPIDNLDTLVERLIESLLPEFNRLPFAFFGHSFGSLIAFELTRKLAKFGLPLPKHLFVSAYPDPCMPAKSLNNLLEKLHSKNINLLTLTDAAKLSTLDQAKLRDLVKIFNENGVVDYGDHLIDQTIVKALMPIFVADMNIVRTYHYHADTALTVPITVFLGKQDQWVSHEDHLGWQTHTTQGCEFYQLDSGHLFIREEHSKQKVLAKIAATLNLTAS